jgi:hypothetical protein
VVVPSEEEEDGFLHDDSSLSNILTVSGGWGPANETSRTLDHHSLPLSRKG